MINKIIIASGFIILLLCFGVVFVVGEQEERTQVANKKSSNDRVIPCSKEVTSSLIEGPYYTKNSPEKNDFVNDGRTGEVLSLSGYVLDSNCHPISNAWVDFWQTDSNGDYDNSGYVLRGHQYTDENGMYTLRTIIPGEYPGRTLHIHVAVRATDQSPTIISQLFIPGIDKNNADEIFTEKNLITVSESSDGKKGEYNFIVPLK